MAEISLEKGFESLVTWSALSLSFLGSQNASSGYSHVLTHPYVTQAIQFAYAAAPKSLTVPQCTGIAIALTPILLTFAPTSLFRKALYPLQLYFLFGALLAPLPPHTPQAALYNLGLLLGTWGARIIDRVYMHAPETTFLRKGLDDKPGHGPATYGPMRKFLWGAELVGASRGNGWNWAVGGIPRPEVHSRLAFVWERVKKTMVTFFLIHLVSLASEAILTEDDMLAGSSLQTWMPLLRNRDFLQVFLTIGWLAVIYGHMTLPENLIAIALVGTGIAGRWSDPDQWPPMFGNISEAYSLRRCWGKFWHAALRRSTNAPGEWLVANFPAMRRPKSHVVRLIKRYGLLFLAFFVSGLIHASGSYMVTRDSALGVSDGGAFIYFMAQPAAILLEDMIFSVLGIADDGNPSRVRRVLGYAYVAAFWLYSFPHLKVMPLAKAHGLHDPRGSMLGAVRACAELAEALPFNPVKLAMVYLMART